jgi:hypothetical protein
MGLLVKTTTIDPGVKAAAVPGPNKKKKTFSLKDLVFFNKPDAMEKWAEYLAMMYDWVGTLDEMFGANAVPQYEARIQKTFKRAFGDQSPYTADEVVVALVSRCLPLVYLIPDTDTR